MKSRLSRIRRQKGYVLLSVMLLITLMIIAMSVAIPRISQQIKREKEEELVHRGKEYALAVKRFYHKTGQYPVSLDQLENTNNMRFLRKKFKDPITGEADWKLVHQGEATIKIPTTGAQQQGNINLPTSATPTPTPSNSPPNQIPKPPGTAPTIQPGQAGPGIIGVASTSKATGIKEFNDKTHYNEWLFVYDPRLEQGGNGIMVAEPSGSGTNSGSLGSLPTSNLPTSK